LFLRRVPRFFWTQATADKTIREQRQMRFDFLVELVLKSAASERSPQPR
jgi:hypothetical protein